MARAGHPVKAYHADNGCFKEDAFLASCNEKDQSFTLCGVGDYHQNGIIKNRNKYLTLTACTLLLHAMRMWPGMTDTMFWPFALIAAADCLNTLHLNPDRLTPESRLHGVELEELPVKSFHTLFYPVYILDHSLHDADSLGPPKWNPCSRVGVYLGHSPFHAGNMALVFNIKPVESTLNIMLLLFIERGCLAEWLKVLIKYYKPEYLLFANTPQQLYVSSHRRPDLLPPNFAYPPRPDRRPARQLGSWQS